MSSVVESVDLESLLASIPGENPAGVSLKYTGLYDEIREARRVDENLAQDICIHEPKLADWRQVISLITEALATRTKDLQLCAWLAEALTRLYGFGGLRDGLWVLHSMIERFWDCCYPVIDEGDLEARTNLLVWLDRQLATAAKKVLMTQTDRGSNYSYLQWVGSQQFRVDSVRLERIDEPRAQAAEKGKITSEQWRAAKNATPRKFYEVLDVQLNECQEAFQAIDGVATEKFGPEMPRLGELKKALDAIRLLITEFLEEERKPEPVLEQGDGMAGSDGVYTQERGREEEMLIPPPPPPESIPPLYESSFATVRIFYATDRKPTGQLEPANFYGSDRSDGGQVSLGICEVSIPRDHRMGALEAPSIWKLQFRPNPERHIVLLSASVQDPTYFFTNVAERINQSPKKEAFVFIHGFNVTFEDAARRTAQLAYDLAFAGAPILYSWPSMGSLLCYTVDEATIEWTIPHLKVFLEDLAVRSGATTVHLIAHSMGNRALTRALQFIAGEHPVHLRPRFQQVVLTAPDIDAEVFKDLAKQIQSTADRITLYASSRDEAIKASKGIHGYPRAGESGDSIIIVSGIDTIDTSGVDTSFLGHSYYGDNRSVLSDLFELIKDGKPPKDRFGLRSVQRANGEYWMFKP